MSKEAKKAIVYGASEKNFTALREHLHTRDFTDVLRARNRAEARELLRADGAQLAIIAIDGNRGVKPIEIVKRDRPDLPIITIGPGADPDLIVQAVRAGASEFVVEPPKTGDLDRAIDRALHASGQSRRSGKCVALYSAKGGVGNTTLAVNLAHSLSRMERQARVALVDLVVQAGDVRTLLDLKPKYTIRDLVEKVGQVDGGALESLLHHHSERLWVCPDPQQPDESELVDADRVRSVLDHLARSFDYVVIDCEHQLNDRTLGALDLADIILLPANLTVPSVRSLQRSLELFQRLGYPERKLAIVVNRHGARGDLTLADVQKLLPVPVAATLPNDYHTTLSAAAHGQPIQEVAPRSKLVSGLNTLAARLNGNPEGSARGSGGWGRLLRRFRRNRNG